MKSLIPILAAASAFALGTPALGQTANFNAGGTVGIDNRIAQLEARFQAGLRQGTITANEARMLGPELRTLRRLHYQYNRNGLTRWERSDLQQRIRSIRQELRYADGGNAYYDRQWAYNDNASYYGQGGPFEEADACVSRDGIRGVLDSMIGTRCLRVGDRARGNLYAVPGQYRNEFFDGNGVYYRSDGRLIYEIDANSNTVLRSFAINR